MQTTETPARITAEDCERLSREFSELMLGKVDETSVRVIDYGWRAVYTVRVGEWRECYPGPQAPQRRVESPVQPAEAAAALTAWADKLKATPKEELAAIEVDLAL